MLHPLLRCAIIQKVYEYRVYMACTPFACEEHNVSIMLCLYAKFINFSKQNTSTPEEVAKRPPPRNAPHIAVFYEEGSRQYFIWVERQVLCQLHAHFFPSLYVLFGSYYLFHAFTLSIAS